MSGGSLNYFYTELEDHVGDFGDKELDNLVKDLATLFYDREWFLSGDTGEGSWREARKAFKAKWFTKHGREERIEQYLKDLTKEVRESFELDDRRCMDCANWKRISDYYGSCPDETCSMHRSEVCDKWERKSQ